ncbi:MAG: hypothetical protein KC462_09670 [Cyanobacteria bacterium HKST-UBA05]|nr:hypothetical protein [Cyanobacteria bacterium HKST-UBA05]
MPWDDMVTPALVMAIIFVISKMIDMGLLPKKKDLYDLEDRFDQRMETLTAQVLARHEERAKIVDERLASKLRRAEAVQYYVTKAEFAQLTVSREEVRQLVADLRQDVHAQIADIKVLINKIFDRLDRPH